jgi:putative transposase
VAGRKRISTEIQDLIFRMVAENPTWGAPRLHGELMMLGLDVSERTISRWMKRAPRGPELVKRWSTFLRNHREANAAMDFFTVPTIKVSLLYCLFVISHDRRQIFHFNVTKHPTSLWVVQQLREAFPYDGRAGKPVWCQLRKELPTANQDLTAVAHHRNTSPTALIHPAQIFV